MHLTFLPLVLLPLLTSAHFSAIYPRPREADEDNQGEFPCGGANKPSPSRTQWSLTGGPIQLDLGHERSLVQVLLGLGNDVGENFNITLLPTVQEEGPGEFCFENVAVPASLGLRQGQNGTIQVVTDAHSDGGYYNVCVPPLLPPKPRSTNQATNQPQPQCLDVTFSTTPDPPTCRNDTGTSASAYSGPFINANGTVPRNGTSGAGGNSTSAGNATSTEEEELSAETAATADTPVSPSLATGLGVTAWLVAAGLALGGGLVLWH